MKLNEGERWCPSCGERMKAGDPSHPTVTRVVRPRNKYGDATPGALVLVEPRHLDMPAVLGATMSLDEYEEIEGKRRAAAPVPGAKPRLVQMIEAGLEGAIAQTRAIIEAGKARVARDAERAVASAQTLLGQPPTG